MMLDKNQMESFKSKYPSLFSFKGEGWFMSIFRIKRKISPIRFAIRHTEFLINEVWNPKWLLCLIARDENNLFDNAINYIEQNKNKITDEEILKDTINCCDYLKQYKERKNSRSIDSVKERMAMHTIINESGLKVRIMHCAPFIFNSIQTIVEEFKKINCIDLLIVLGEPEYYKNYAEKLKTQCDDIKVKSIEYSKYNIENDKPDIFIFNQGNVKGIFDGIGGIEKININTRLICMIPYDNADKMQHYRHWDCINDLRKDLFIVSPTIYNDTKKYYEDVISMGSPKFDLIYRSINENDEYPVGWEKLKGKKTIVYTTVHGHEVGGDYFSPGITLDLYFKAIIDYFNENNDMALIFRPHPALIEEYVDQHEIWSYADLEAIKRLFKDSNNMVWDDLTDYSKSFAFSNALLTDSLTGINFTYLPTRKPICVAYRNTYDVTKHNEELIENYYKAYSWDQIYEFFEMIKNGQDYMYEKRMKTVEKYIPVFDGNNGKEIVRIILEKYKNDQG